MLGVDVGQRHIRVALMDATHAVLAEREAPLSGRPRIDGVLSRTASVVEGALADAEIGAHELAGVGMGVPWLVQRSASTAGATRLTSSAASVPTTAISDALNLPPRLLLHVDNDANLGALGEWVWGAARGHTDIVYLKVATGIGAGLILDGRLHHGAGGTAGEIGHFVTDPAGPPCRCGKHGCLEAVAGGPALLAKVQAIDQDHGLSSLVRFAQDGDQQARQALDEAGQSLGHALAAVCDLLNPELIIVGGELADAGTLLLDPLRQSLQESAMDETAADVRVVTAELSVRAPVMGALALAVRST